jgi:hypothetical protein
VAYALLGRAASPEAIAHLTLALRQSTRDRDLAAYALSTSPAEEAGAAISGLLGDPRALRDAARAAVLRSLALADEPDGLRPALVRLLASSDASDRAAGAWGTAALDETRRRELIGSTDPVVAAAAARTLVDRSSRFVAAERLARSPSPQLRDALALALSDLEAARVVPTSVLVELLETSATSAPLAARALAARGGEDLEARIEELMGSGDAVIRAHAALGLGAGTDPRAVGRLADAYRFEPDPVVRRAIVRALGLRREPSRRRTLELAARLDPDRDARRLAELALRGTALTVDPGGDGALWLSLGDADAVATSPAGHSGEGDRAGTGWRAVAVVGPTGLALPFLADPDGRLTVWGLPKGRVATRLALAPARGEALRPSSKRSPAPNR